MHVDLDSWSRGDSWLHRRDARAKLLATLFMLIAVGTSAVPLAHLAPVACAAAVSRLPPVSLAARAALVLPFTLSFAAVSILGGDWNRAYLVIIRSMLSAATVAILTGVTPLPSLVRGAERLGAPRLLMEVIQFLYRYLYVLYDQAARMRWASQSRGGFRWEAAGGAIGVLFASSYQRAEAIHRAMLARGFDGRLQRSTLGRMGAADIAMAAGVAGTLSAARLVWGF
ncbi:MAG: energy-coupling factor transporter transmembrane component T [Bryobacteraceae bacterium]